MNRFFISLFSFLFYIQQALCLNVNYRALNLYADSFKDCIYAKYPVSTNLIQEGLFFLDDNEESEIKDYLHNKTLDSFKNRLEEIGSKEIKDFFDECKYIYDYVDDIFPTTQAAVYMLFEEVLKKFEEQRDKDIKWRNALLSYTARKNDMPENKPTNISKTDITIQGAQSTTSSFTTKRLADDSIDSLINPTKKHQPDPSQLEPARYIIKN